MHHAATRAGIWAEHLVVFQAAAATGMGLHGPVLFCVKLQLRVVPEQLCRGQPSPCQAS